MAGLTDNGFDLKDLNTISEEIKDDLQTTFGPSLNVDADSVTGQITDVFAAELSEVWELAEAIYTSMDRDSSTGDALENISKLIGLPDPRLAAAPTTGTVTFTGDQLTTIPEGTVVRNPGTDERFETVEPVTLPSAPGSAPTSVDALVEALEDGPIQADIGTITGIVTAISGVNSVTNAAKFIPGRDLESDAALRLRQKESLNVGGKSVDQAIKAEVLEVEGVTETIVISNRSLSTDGFGIPGKSFLTVVWPASADTTYREAIGEAIFLSQPAGILAHGDVDVTVTDSQDYTQTVSFSFATEQVFEVTITLVTTNRYPSNGDDQVTAVVTQYGDDFNVGDDFKWLELVSRIYEEVPGIDDIQVDWTNTTDAASGTDSNYNTALTDIITIAEGDVTIA